MKKAILIIFLVLFSSFTIAQTTQTTEPTMTAIAVPGDLAYPIKRLFESIQLIFTFREVDKAKLQLDFADRRLDEAKVLTTRNEDEKALALIKEHDLLVQRVEARKRTLTDTIDAIEVDGLLSAFITNREPKLNELRGSSAQILSAVTTARNISITTTAGIQSVSLIDVVKKNFSGSEIEFAKRFCNDSGGTWHMQDNWVGCENRQFDASSCGITQVKTAMEKCEFFGARSVCSGVNLYCKR